MPLFLRGGERSCRDREQWTMESGKWTISAESTVVGCVTSKKRMILIAKMFVLSLVFLVAVQAGYTQDISTVLKDVEASLPNDTSGWRIHRKQERDQGKVIELDWVHEKEIVGVYLYQESSVEAAAQLLYKMRTAPVAS